MKAGILFLILVVASVSLGDESVVQTPLGVVQGVVTEKARSFKVRNFFIEDIFSKKNQYQKNQYP